MSGEPLRCGRHRQTWSVAAARQVWAKSRPPQSVWDHGIATAGAVARLVQLDDPVVARMAAACDMDAETLWRVMRWVGAIHDSGKACAAFQGRDAALGRRVAAMGLAVGGQDPVLHGARTLDIVERYLRTVCACSSETAWCLGRVAASHHGWAPEMPLWREVDPQWVMVQDALLDEWRTETGVSTAMLRSVRRIPAWCATAWSGVLAVADWLASAQACDTGMGVDDACDRLAITPPVTLPADGGGYAALYPNVRWTPTQMQEVVLRVASETHPQLVLVVHPTGTGKTEAALAAADRMQRRLRRGGIYVALPTRATSDAMFDRVRAVITRREPAAVPHVHLVHSGSAPYVTDTAGAEGAAAAWYQQSRHRSLLAPYGVGTVDQAVMSVLATTHHAVRLWGLLDSVVILDEIHAYDVYTTTIIERFLMWAGAAGIPVIALTATLPHAQRRQLVAAYGGAPEAVTPTPSSVISTRHDGAANQITLDVPSRAPVYIQAVPDLGAVVARLLGVIQDGGCAGLVANTVARAQEAYSIARTLAGANTDVEIIHARYPAWRRAEREAGLRERYGPGVEARPHSALVVGTQILEQSLDLDFDVLGTDLAPADALVQRMGRLHRHARPRPPGLERPQLYWVAPPLDAAGLPRWTAQRIYSAYVMWRTWLWLTGREQITDVQDWIEAVYTDEPPVVSVPAFEAAVAQAREADARQRAVTRAAAQDLLLRAPEAVDVWPMDTVAASEDDLGGAAPSADVYRVRTRLGPVGMTVVCAHVTATGLHLDGAAVPVRLLSGMADLRRAVYGASVAVTDRRVRTALQPAPRPAWLRRAVRGPWCAVAEFRGGVANLDGYWRLRLDDATGLHVEAA